MSVDPAGPGGGRAAWVEVDLDAVRANVAWLRARVAPAAVCAVVKADGYGHGAVGVARAALAAGADRLAVATVAEAAQLRAAGVEARILLLSEPGPDEWAAAAAAAVEPAVYSVEGIDAAAAAATGRPWAVHLKVDTGMHRAGCAPGDAVALAARIGARPTLRLASVWSHLATADEPAGPDDFTATQVARMDEVLAALAAASVPVPEVHLANSAGALAHPAARRDLVRCGIAVYGLAPGPAVAALAAPLRPAMAVRARVALVRAVAAGEGASYGLRWRAPTDTTLAVVPLGYADGVPRHASARGVEVLVGGVRRPIVGTVTMDQLLVDCGPGAAVARGDEVVLIGVQGDAEVTAAEWAERLGTISYEVVCGFSRRLPRRELAGPAAGPPGERG